MYVLWLSVAEINIWNDKELILDAFGSITMIRCDYMHTDNVDCIYHFIQLFDAVGWSQTASLSSRSQSSTERTLSTPVIPQWTDDSSGRVTIWPTTLVFLVFIGDHCRDILHVIRRLLLRICTVQWTESELIVSVIHRLRVIAAQCTRHVATCSECAPTKHCRCTRTVADYNRRYMRPRRMQTGARRPFRDLVVVETAVVGQ